MSIIRLSGIKHHFKINDGVVDILWHSEKFLTPIEKKSKEDLL